MKVILFLAVLVANTYVFAQRYTGLSFSNYQGAISIQDNPSTFSNKEPGWDLNIAGYGFMAYSNYAYISDQSILSMTNKKNVYFVPDTLPPNYNKETSALAYANSKSSGYYDFMMNTTLYGPSLAFKVKSWSFGLFTTMRATATQGKIPAFFDYNNLDTIHFYSNYELKPMEINAMAWSEIGGNFAKQITLQNGNKLSIGANLKVLLGHEASYIYSQSTISTQRLHDSILIASPNFEIGYATGAQLNSNNYKFQVNGMGFGMDLGVEYMKINEDFEESNPTPYKYKLGASIVDLGYIAYDKNAQVNVFNSQGIIQIPDNLNKNTNSTKEIMRRLSYIVYGDSTKSNKGTSFSMYLPTALNLHADVQIWNYIFGSALISRSIAGLPHQTRAGNVMLIGARYERKWLEVGTDFSLIEDKWMGWGAFVRLGFLTVGTHHLNSLFFKQSQLNGFDAYLSLKMIPFSLHFGKGSLDSDDGKSKGSRYGCYTF